MKADSRELTALVVVLAVMVSLTVVAVHASAGLVEDRGRVMNKSAESRIYVELIGPGERQVVYRIAPGATVADLFNFARIRVPKGVWGTTRLHSGTAVTVRDDGQMVLGRMGGDRLIALGIPMNLNAATVDDLIAIPGIGRATATKIVSARMDSGGFRSYDDVDQVNGIGPKTLENLVKYSTL